MGFASLSLPADLVRDRTLTWTGKAVCGFFLQKIQEAGIVACIEQVEIADALGISDRTLGRTLGDLERNGWVVITHGGSGRNTYRIGEKLLLTVNMADNRPGPGKKRGLTANMAGNPSARRQKPQLSAILSDADCAGPPPRFPPHTPPSYIPPPSRQKSARAPRHALRRQPGGGRRRVRLRGERAPQRVSLGA